MWSVLNVPTMWYFIFPRQRGMFLLFLQCGILTVLAVWYIICPRQYGMFLLSRQWNSKNIQHCRGQLKYHTVGKVITFHIVVDITHCRGQLKYHTVGTVRTLQIVGDS
jgi:hypothetical protein